MSQTSIENTKPVFWGDERPIRLLDFTLFRGEDMHFSVDTPEFPLQNFDVITLLEKNGGIGGHRASVGMGAETQRQCKGKKNRKNGEKKRNHEEIVHFSLTRDKY